MATSPLAADSGREPYCHMTASNSSSVAGRGRSVGPTAVAQRWVAPSGSWAMPMVKRGTMRWPWRESRKGSAPSATTPVPGRCTASSQGMAARTPAASSASTNSGGTPADQGEPGAVEQNGGAAVELERIGPVLEGDGAGVQAGVVHRGAGAPVRVA